MSNNILNHLSDIQPKWFAVKTKYKCEKFVVNQLNKKSISCFLPLISVSKRYSSKIKHYQTPLIHCYVFVYITKNQYVTILKTEYVLGFLKQRKDLIAIPDKEIELLRTVVGQYNDVTISNYDLYIGDKVEIISGELTGVKGILKEKLGKQRFLIKLDSLSLVLNMSIEKTKIRLVKRA